VPDPSELIHYMPDADATPLRSPHALVSFGGWVDAGSGGTGAVRHLITNLKSRKLAEMDSEEFYSFTDTRPLVSIVGAGERAVHWPRGEFHGATLEHDRDLVLFVAPEPNLKWPTFATVMLDGMQHLGVQSMVCIGSIFGAVPHRGDVRMTGWANNDQMRDALAQHNVMFTNYEGPTGFVTALLAEAEARQVPAVAVYGFAPNYIQGVPNPRVSHALLKTFSALTGVPLQLSDLDRAGRALARQVDRLLQDQPQLREQVERMLSLMNVAEPLVEPEDESEPSAMDEPPGPSVELPSPQAVVSELEEFLKQLRRQDPGTPPDE
jgi:proteasome assembly chaperone (PAC2) family protein